MGVVCAVPGASTPGIWDGYFMEQNSGCLQLLEIYWNLKNPPGNLEFPGSPRNFCARWSTALVSGHKTGYQIA